MTGLDKLHIFRGRFHSSKALSDHGAYILEIETPEDKHDLVRLEDSYGREKTGYEGKAFESPKHETCLWLGEPVQGDSVSSFNRCTLRHFIARGKSTLRGFSSTDYFIVARGGIIAKRNATILWPGDVIDGVSLERLSDAFAIIPRTTMIQVSMK